MSSPQVANTPFVLTLQRLDETPNGSFRPSARIELTPMLRISGLLLALPGEELRTLLLVLTFVHPNGYVQPSLLELAQALHVSPLRTSFRLRRLARFLWEGRPLVQEWRRESGLHTYAPSAHILGLEESLTSKPTAEPLLYQTAGRDAVIASSRAQYARPREEVEREIAALNGWPWPSKSLSQLREEYLRVSASSANAPPTEPPYSSSLSVTPTPMSTLPTEERAALKQYLITLGVPAEEAESLIARFDPARIRQQIEWLPLRHANHPARLLAAAIEGDYEAPAALRQTPVPTVGPLDVASTSSNTDLPIP
jgi:hypothetical protein